jgi:hypothetical protein
LGSYCRVAIQFVHIFVLGYNFVEVQLQFGSKLLLALVKLNIGKIFDSDSEV